MYDIDIHVFNVCIIDKHQVQLLGDLCWLGKVAAALAAELFVVALPVVAVVAVVPDNHFLASTVNFSLRAIITSRDHGSRFPHRSLKNYFNLDRF